MILRGGGQQSVGALGMDVGWCCVVVEMEVYLKWRVRGEGHDTAADRRGAAVGRWSTIARTNGTRVVDIFCPLDLE